MRGLKSFRSLVLAPVSSVLVAGIAVIACGDDDTTNPSATPDGGGQADVNVTPNPTDGGNDSSTADADAATPAPAVRPQTTAKLLNAINPYGLVFASDGFLYASGATMNGGTRELAVWRFKDGALDTTFGTMGVLTKDITGDESSWDLVEVSAGNFVIQATAGGKVYLLKMTKDAGSGAFTIGDPVEVKFSDWLANDPDWAGTAPLPTAPAYSSWSIAVDRSVANTPKIVVFASGAPPKVTSGTQRFDNDRWIARVMADTLAADGSFNNGKAFSSDSDGKGLNDNSRRGLVLADGSIISAGYTNFEGTVRHHVVIIKLTNTGAADTAFGFGSANPGETKINPFLATSGNTEAYGVVRQSTGRLVTTGYGTSNFDVASKSVDLISLGVLPGSLDATYGKQGAFGFQSEQDPAAGVGTNAHGDRGRDLAVLPDDRTVHFGAYDDFAAIYVLDKNGKADVGSGVNGLLEYSMPTNFFRGVVSPDGKTLAATTASINVTIDGGTVPQSFLATLKVGQ